MKPRGRPWSALVFAVLGFCSLAWFLLRVVPKPRRAAYPCQRVAAPLAGTFLAWLGSLLLSTFAFTRSRRLVRCCRPGPAAALMIVSAVLMLVVVARIPVQRADANPGRDEGPIGEGRGIHPGRVVWVHDPDATDWGGFKSPEHWWQSNHTDKAAVEAMFAKGIRALAGQGTVADAWDALFRHFNETAGRGYRGYSAGEKIAVKLNLVTCIQIDPESYEKAPDHMNRIDPSPQMIRALLDHLVNTVGVAQADITLGDTTSYIPDYYWDMLTPEFPDVHWVDNYGGSGRERAEFSSVPIHWSTTNAAGCLTDYIPQCFAQADYIINFAVLKGHSVGITGCGKNHYGSLIRTPNGVLRGVSDDYYDLHLSLPNPGWSPGTAKYRAIVDLMGHPHLGRKTMLYIIDGLFAGYYWEAIPKKWFSPPFGNGVDSDWPSSLFVSQDPVAIDSVAHDFLRQEWPNVVTGGVLGPGALQGGEDDYLHEAALAHAPPSATFYDPDNDGIRLSSLGVHEHWNNAASKQYSRNLGLSEGIELVSHTATTTVYPEAHPGLQVASIAVSNVSEQLCFRNLSPGLEYTVQRSTSLVDCVWSNIETFAASHHQKSWTNFGSLDHPMVFWRIRPN